MVVVGEKFENATLRCVCLYASGCVARRAKWGQAKLPPVWDIEEAVRLGKGRQACPYYTARASMATADLVLW